MGQALAALEAADATETLGINSRVQLAEAARVMQRRINERHMLAGVTMTAPDLVWIGPDVRLGRDVVIEPMTTLTGSAVVGDGCVLGPNVRITDATLGAACVVDSSIIEDVVIAAGVESMTRVPMGSPVTLAMQAGLGRGIALALQADQQAAAQRPGQGQGRAG